MIGCVVTGHGEFAPGLTQALTMIAGTQEHFRVVSFQELEPLETFAGKLSTAVDELLQATDGVLIFTDLLGGTPFRTAMLVAANDEKVIVLTGTNLPMLIEIGLLSTIESDVQALAQKAVEVGLAGVQMARLQPIGLPPEPADDEAEGI